MLKGIPSLSQSPLALELIFACLFQNQQRTYLGFRGVSRISARGVLKVRPYTKSGGGGGQFASGPIRKVGGGQFASGPIRKVGGGGGRYLCLAQRKYLIVNYKRL